MKTAGQIAREVNARLEERVNEATDKMESVIAAIMTNDPEKKFCNFHADDGYSARLVDMIKSKLYWAGYRVQVIERYNSVNSKSGWDFRIEWD